MLSSFLVQFLCFTNIAEASTYYMSDVGIRAMGRGGAFVAGADDISAQWYNPSALTRINGIHFQIDLMGVKQEMYFDRQDYPGNGPMVDGNPTDLVTEPIRNGASPLPIPHFGFIHDFGNPDLTVLLGFTTPTPPTSATQKAVRNDTPWKTQSLSTPLQDQPLLTKLNRGSPWESAQVGTT